MPKIRSAAERTDELSSGEVKDIKREISRNNMQNGELHQYATRNEEAQRRYDEGEKETLQNPYESDTRRIAYDNGFKRYGGKTQVVTMPDNPHISTRLLHCEKVAIQGRSISRSLGYNQDLAEAIGRGHDLGHAPIGHLGESYLSMATLSHSLLSDRQEIFAALGPFMHSVQSMMAAEWVMQQNGRRAAGLNLNLQTLHGFGSHDGESNTMESKWIKLTPENIKEDLYRYINRVLEESVKVEFKGDPQNENEVESHIKGIHKRLKENKITLTPATPEASVIRILDSLVYLADDVDDYNRLCTYDGRNPNLPAVVADELGTNSRDILKNGIADLLLHSFNKDKITYSERKGEAIKLLKSFLYKNFYEPQNDHVFAMRNRKPWERMLGLIERCTDAMLLNQDTSRRSALSGVPYLEEYLDVRDRDMGDYYKKMWHISDARLKIHQVVRDFIAGCTDEYFYKITD